MGEPDRERDAIDEATISVKHNSSSPSVSSAASARAASCDVTYYVVGPPTPAITAQNTESPSLPDVRSQCALTQGTMKGTTAAYQGEREEPQVLSRCPWRRNRHQAGEIAKQPMMGPDTLGQGEVPAYDRALRKRWRDVQRHHQAAVQGSEPMGIRLLALIQHNHCEEQSQPRTSSLIRLIKQSSNVGAVPNRGSNL